jgi:predicted ABC-type ATPase
MYACRRQGGELPRLSGQLYMQLVSKCHVTGITIAIHYLSISNATLSDYIVSPFE